MYPVNTQSSTLAPGNFARASRFGRKATPEELETLKSSFKELNLDENRLEALTVRVIENADSMAGRLKYRFLEMPFDWIRTIWGYLQHWGTEPKPYDIRWHTFDKAKQAEKWGKQCQLDCDERNLEFKKDKDPVEFKVHVSKPNDTSVLKILIHTPDSTEKDAPTKAPAPPKKPFGGLA